VVDNDFSRSFIDESRQLLARVSVEDVDAVVGVLAATKARRGRLFFCGSGGGAGHSSHAACDFRKLAAIEAYSVTDNVSELTARINDDGWDDAYAAWLRVSNIAAEDCLFVFSVGGGDEERNISVNLVNAMRLAAERGAPIVGIVGRDGGLLRRLAEASVVVPVADPSNITAQTEGLQALLWHLIVTHPRLCSATPKWESMTR
jgi:D-sedoheptulose 7-phosphate isomerase